MTYSRWERFVFWLTGRWPDAVVRRRLDEDELLRAGVELIVREHSETLRLLGEDD
jgi:hypothetical protein